MSMIQTSKDGRSLSVVSQSLLSRGTSSRHRLGLKGDLENVISPSRVLQSQGTA